MASRTSLPILEFATLLVVILGCVIAVVPGADEYAISLFASQDTSETMGQVVDNEVPAVDQQLADDEGFLEQPFEQPFGEPENSVVADNEPSTMAGQLDSPANEEYDLELSELPDNSVAFDSSDSSDWELDFHPEVEDVASAPIEVEQLPAIDEFAVNDMDSEDVGELSIMKPSETTELATDDDEFMQDLLDEPSGSETEFIAEFNEEVSQVGQVANRTKTRSRTKPAPAPVPFTIVPDQATPSTVNEVAASIPWESSEERAFVATDLASGRNEPPRQFAGREQANQPVRQSELPASTVSGLTSFRPADDENSNWKSNPAYQRWMRESSLRDRGHLPGEQSWERVYNEFIDNPGMKSSGATSPAFKPVGFAPTQVQNDHFDSQWPGMDLKSYARQQNAGTPPPVPGQSGQFASSSDNANANSHGDMPRVFSPVQNGNGNERVIRRPMSANSMRQNGEFRRNR